MTATAIATPFAPVANEPMQQGAAKQSEMKLRITRRGRVVLSVLAVLSIGVTMGLASIIGAPSATASDSVAGSADFAYVIIQPGESLWSVASALDPAADPRDIISEIVRLNQLSESSVQAGQPIAVPLRYSETTGVLSAEQLGL